ncbi:DUF2463 domain-containing protein [Encephalitozoon intestinalis]|nr:DUF2463 domain-containing protein [Encephalitozoon intestinalis]UTX46151.1 DUF2463 domain-containing protein [Encephalitozoon intestinalis]
MLSIPIPKQTSTPKDSYNLNLKQKFPCLLHLYSSFATPISILIPLLMNITLPEDAFKKSSFTRFIFFAIPLFHLTLLNFRLYQNVYSFSYKSTSKLYSTSYLILRPLFLLFAIISFLSIFAFSAAAKTKYIQTSSLLSLFLLSATHFFPTSFSLTPNSIQFQDSGIGILADLSLFIVPFFEGNHTLFLLYFFFFTLFKSQRIPLESPKSIDTTVWRQIVFLLFFIILTAFYLLMGLFPLSLILQKHSLTSQTF